MALTDSNGVYGLIFFLDACREYGLTPIIGTEVRYNGYRFVVLVKNQAGYGAMTSFLSRMHQQLFKQTIFQELSELYENSVIFTDNKDLLLGLKSHMPQDSLYYEVSPHFHSMQDIKWLRENKILPIATNRTLFLSPHDYSSYLLLQAIKYNTTLASVKANPYHHQSCYLKTPEQIRRSFAHLPDAIENTVKVAKMCEASWFERKTVFPSYNNLCPAESAELLRQKAVEGITSRYPKMSRELKRKIWQRLNKELDTIVGKDFSSYFLIVQDIVRQSPRTCGRGSAAASLVSYLLHITHVDPIKHNLFFERFLNPDRIDPPDIDVDFPWDERDDVLDYVFKKYPGHCAMVANHNTLQGRSSVREVAKVYGVPEDEISYVTKRFPRVSLNQQWRVIVQEASKLMGCFHNLSVHCGGVVITPKPIDRYVPVEMATKGVPVIQWEKDQTEEAGLVKIDLLGNRSLAVIRDTLHAVGSSLSYSELNPIHDQKTADALKSGETMGVFYIESPATKLLLNKMRSADFEHIVIASSIIRPASNMYANEFAMRLNGKPYDCLHPMLDDVLDESYGIMVYQEQVTQTAMALADFTPSEGNMLRKVLGKKHKETKLRDLKQKFYNGAKNKSVPLATIDRIWEMILSFAGYSFCKPHSASYALVSFKALYLKVHYPAEFMAAVISNQGGFYSTHAYIDEARRMNLKILPPDVNTSDYHYNGRGDQIRTGLMQIKHLTRDCIESILEARKEGSFSTLADFLERVGPHFDDAKILLKSRAFSSLKEDKSYCSMMWEIYHYKAKQERVISNQTPVPMLRPKEFESYQFVLWEQQYFDGTISFPDWLLYQKAIKAQGRTQGAELPYNIGKDVLLFGKKVTGKRVRTKHGEEMSFVTFSDESSIFETVLFPQAFEEFRDILLLGGSFMMVGEVQNELGAIQVNIRKMRRIT